MYPYFLRQKCSPKNLVFSNIWPMAIYAEITANECIIKRHLRIIDASLICVEAFLKVSLCCRFDRNGPTSTIWLVGPSIRPSHWRSTPDRFNSHIEMPFALYDRAIIDACFVCGSCCCCCCCYLLSVQSEHRHRWQACAEQEFYDPSTGDNTLKIAIL